MRDIISQVRACVEAQVPCIWVDDPGTAKTACVAGIARALNRPFVSFSAAQVQAEDISGIPMPGSDYLNRQHDEWLRPMFDGPAIVLIDEFGRATNRAVRNACLRLLQERRAGDRRVHKGASFVATGNLSSNDMDTMDTPSALANRVAWFTGRMPLEFWLDWMLGGNGLGQPEPGPFRPEARALVASFVAKRPELAHKLPKEVSQQGGPWPSWRSWHNASRLLATAMCSAGSASLVGTPSFDMAIALVGGCVGDAPAVELGSYLREMDLPDWTEAVKPSFRWPVRSDRAHAICNSVIVGTAGASANLVGPAACKPYREALDAFQRAKAEGVDGSVAANAAIQLLKHPACPPEFAYDDSDVAAFGDMLVAAGFYSRGNR